MNGDIVCITPVTRGSSGKRETTIHITRVAYTTGQRQKLSPNWAFAVTWSILNFETSVITHETTKATVETNFAQL